MKKLEAYQREPQFGKVPSFVCVHSFAQHSTFFTMFEQRFTQGERDVQHIVQGATFGTTCNTGWRRLIGSPKLQIIFHKRATKYRALLRKMTYKDKRSYESSPPCITTCMQRLVLCTMCHVLHNYLPKIGKGLSPRRRFWPQLNLYHNGSRRFCRMQRRLNLHHSVK